MEGVAFAFRDCRRVLHDAGTELGQLIAVGGGSKSELWLKLIATNLDTTIAIPEDGDFGGALGVARLGLCAAEGVDPATVMQAPAIKRIITPDAALTDALCKAIRALSRALPRHRGGPYVTDFFKGIAPVKFEGPSSTNALAYRHYNKDEIVLGKRMEDHIRPAIAYWHTFAWEGGDPFGGRTFDRPWYAGSPLEGAKVKADVAFEMFDLLDAPFFCFHDADVAPEGATLAESNKNLRTITDIFAKKMQSSRTKLLWGTANLFSNRRYMAGAADQPRPLCLRLCRRTGEGDAGDHPRSGGFELCAVGRPRGLRGPCSTPASSRNRTRPRVSSASSSSMPKRSAFKGQLLIEPKPQEPTKHQYDYDVATVYGFLKTYGLEKDVKVNIEVGHAFLAGHSFEHELAVAGGLGILGSVDANRNDLQSGWDTDQFPNNPGEMALAFYQILKAGGLGKGGFNFDAKVRRQSIDPADLLHGHVGGLDILARGLKGAAAMIEDGTFDKAQDARYAGWSEAGAAAMLKGERTLEQIAQWVAADNINPQPKSGQQEYLENLVNRFV